MSLLSDSVMRFLLPAYCVAYFLATIVYRAWVTKRATGVNPLVQKTSDDVYGYLKICTNCVAVGVAGLIVFYLLFPEYLGVLAPIGWLQADWVRTAGLLVLAASFILTVLAQSSLGGSWRVGIDTSTPTELQISGLFNHSRNPIFLGLRLNMLGIFLVVANAASLALLLLNEVLLGAEVRCEEVHLRELHGSRFAEYCRNVRRWL